jgi:hypothetical protein
MDANALAGKIHRRPTLHRARPLSSIADLFHRFPMSSRPFPAVAGMGEL